MIKQNNNNRTRKRVTLAQIAAEAGVSVSTVNYVISGKPNPWSIGKETQQRVRAAAEKLGYRANAAAKALKTGRSESVLFLGIHTRSYSWNLGLGEVLRGLETALVPKGYAINTCSISHTEDIDTYEEIVRSGRVDGVIVTGADDPKDNILERVHSIAESVGIPLVSLAPFSTDFEEAVVMKDEMSGGEQATAHLIEHGHTRIAMIGASDIKWAAARTKGYKRALEKAGIPIDNDLIISLDLIEPHYAYNAILKAAKSLDFTALFAVSDSIALAAILALKSLGKRVPQDCAVIGYDNASDLAEYVDPPLTTLDNPFYLSGRYAADSIMALIDDKDAEPVLIPVSLVIRESCGCPSKRKVVSNE